MEGYQGEVGKEATLQFVLMCGKVVAGNSFVTDKDILHLPQQAREKNKKAAAI